MHMQTVLCGMGRQAQALCSWHSDSHHPGEVKTLMVQLLRGVKHLHDNWILHRDLKTSNLLLSHAGILKVGPGAAGACPVPSPSPSPSPPSVLAGGGLWAGTGVRVPLEGLHPSGRDPVVPCPRAAAGRQGECWGAGPALHVCPASPLSVS